jgi:hypothetical protein
MLPTSHFRTTAAGKTGLDERERLAVQGGVQFEASVLKELGDEETEAKGKQVCERCGSRMQR